MKEVNNKLSFWHADKHGRFLFKFILVDAIILGVLSQRCPKYTK